MDINKSDFKVIYNVTKNFRNSNSFSDLINNISNNNIQDDSLREVVQKNNIKNVIDVINKLNKFSFSTKNKVLSNQYDNLEATSEGIPNTISDIDSETSIDNFTENFIPNNTFVNDDNDSATSYDVDYEFNMNTEQVNEYNSETSENEDNDNNKYEDNVNNKYEDMNDIVNMLLDSDTDTVSPKRIREKYNYYNKNNIIDLLNML